MILIVGGDSLIGNALAGYLKENNIQFHSSTRHIEFESENRPLIDLSKTKTFEQLPNYNCAVFCAAITDMSRCEKEQEKTSNVNVAGTLTFMKKLLINKVYTIFLSTNQVFDGKNPFKKPDSPRKPINEYGKQKAKIEKYIENSSNVAILRLTKVIHSKLKIFNRWTRNLSNGIPIYAFTDMTLSPITLEEVVEKIGLLVSRKSTGIYQLSGETDISYYDYAQKFGINNGYSLDLVKKDTYKGKIEFDPPKYTSLINV